MLAILLVVSREFFEAVLIISIINAFLQKNKLPEGRRYLTIGILAGILCSVLLAYVLYTLNSWLDGQGVLYFEAGLFLTSALLMTQMVWWMKRMGAKMRGALNADLATSLQRSGLAGIAVVSALGIAREGSEAATYIYSLSLSGQVSALEIISAIVLGAIFAWSFFVGLSRGIAKLSVPKFFAITSLFLFFTAGSMIMDAVARLTELDVLPTLVPVIWNTSSILPPSSWLGQAMKLLVGYRPTPSLMMVLTYGTYWIIVSLTFYRPQFTTNSNRAGAAT